MLSRSCVCAPFDPHTKERLIHVRTASATMFISVTSSQVTQEQGVAVEKFLASFLPRLKKEPGVLAVYHYAKPEKGEESTVMIWRDQESLTAYRTGELIKDAIAFEQKLGLKSTREAYPLIYPVTE